MWTGDARTISVVPNDAVRVRVDFNDAIVELIGDKKVAGLVEFCVGLDSPDGWASRQRPAAGKRDNDGEHLHAAQCATPLSCNALFSRRYPARLKER
jgi:hypothetical protein